jgi:hypothetical protein
MKIIPTAALDKLIQLVELDLKIRKKLVEDNVLTKFGYHPRMKKIHEDNLAYLIDFLSQYGWPKPSEYGKEVFEAAWMMSIHAIEQKKQMKEAALAIKALLDEGEDVAYQYASLYDRIERFEGRGQLYGTQLEPSKNGWQAADLKDPTLVDKHRESIGLPSLAITIKEFNNSDEPGIIENTEEERAKFEAWVQNSDWRK